MRGLDDQEMHHLDRCVRRADGEHVPSIRYFEYHPDRSAVTATHDRLVARGLVNRCDVLCEDGIIEGRIVPTALGRLALRVERLIRNGGALKGAA